MTTRRSPVGQLAAFAAAIAIVLVAIFVGPSLVTRALSGVLVPVASGGPFSRTDSDQCHAAATALAGFPGKEALEAQHLGLGLGANIRIAREQAARAAASYAVTARSLAATASRTDLEDVASRLDDAKAKFGGPMTESEFRSEFERVIATIDGFSTHCVAIDRWIQNNLRE
jgi:hypothetical protein